MKDNSLKLYELFGATLFQKMVFKLEKIKYATMDKLFPNSITFYERQIDKRSRKLCKNLPHEERQALINNYKMAKIRYRKEINTKQNRNYHLNIDNIDETIGYLTMNKRIHKRSAIINAIALIVSILITIATGGILALIASGIIAYTGINLVIDLQCINLQNYNLKRIEINEPKLRRIAAIRQKKQLEKHRDAAALISREIDKSTDIPSIASIVNNSLITDREKKIALLLQMRNVITPYIQHNNIPTIDVVEQKGACL